MLQMHKQSGQWCGWIPLPNQLRIHNFTCLYMYVGMQHSPVIIYFVAPSITSGIHYHFHPKLNPLENTHSWPYIQLNDEGICARDDHRVDNELTGRLGYIVVHPLQLCGQVEMQVGRGRRIWQRAVSILLGEHQ